MSIFLSVVVVLLIAASAAAQPRPKACRYVVDVESGKVAATTQPTVGCEFDGKILITVNNLDNTKYRLHIRNFKFDAADPTKCASPTTAARDLPIEDDDGDDAFKFNLNAERTHTKKRDIKEMGSHARECFKFDIALFPQTSTTTPIDELDPDITITEPQPPPPGAVPKKPGPGR